jgi:hypothetical protein
MRYDRKQMSINIIAGSSNANQAVRISLAVIDKLLANGGNRSPILNIMIQH